MPHPPFPAVQSRAQTGQPSIDWKGFLRHRGTRRARTRDNLRQAATNRDKTRRHIGQHATSRDITLRPAAFPALSHPQTVSFDILRLPSKPPALLQVAHVNRQSRSQRHDRNVTIRTFCVSTKSALCPAPCAVCLIVTICRVKPIAYWNAGFSNL